MKTKKSIYISGQISGTDDYIQRFSECEKNLLHDFDKVINPARICIETFGKPELMSWSDLMFFSLRHLRHCTHIYLMSGWEKSYGARIEQLWAEKLGLIEIREVKE